MRKSFLTAVIGVFLALQPRLADAIVGGEEARADIARHVVMLTTQKSFCSAVVLSPTLLLTAAHCVDEPGPIAVLRFGPDGAPLIDPVGPIALHPRYDPAAYRKRRFTIDVALVSLTNPLPSGYRALSLPARGEDGIVDARYRIAGFGLSVRGDGRTGGKLREALLRGIPPVSDVQLRLEHPAKALVGACQGDSGGPVLRVSNADGSRTEPVLVGLLASARGAEDKRGCGGRSGVALLGPALDWIREEAARFGVRP